MGWITKLIGVVVVVIAIILGIRQYLTSGCYCNEDIDLTGKVVLITGGHSGLGLETTRGLARRKATIYIGCRDPEKAKPDIDKIKSENKNPNIFLLPLDLSSFDSIRQFVTQFQSKKLPVNILINNAGVWMNETREFSMEGFEVTFGLNHLGHFLLTKLLDEQIKSGKGRIVTVSSGLHKYGTVDFDNLNLDHDYNAMQAYCNSKLMNILFSNELARRYAKYGVSSFSLHPGVIATGLHRHLTNPILASAYTIIMGNLGKTPEQGAQTTITAAISKSLEGKTGVFLSECAEADPLPMALDEQLAKKLWDISEKLIDGK